MTLSLPSLHVLTLFPAPVNAILDSSILRRAQAKGLVELSSSDLREYAIDKHRSVDDSPFGGHQGMLMRADVLEKACLAELEKVQGEREQLKIIYLSPRGYRLDQPMLEHLSNWLLKASVEVAEGGVANVETSDPETPRRIVFVCGRYEGVDERWVRKWVNLELSLGDFIITGGELGALVAIDGIVRLLPGVLGDNRSAPEDSFSTGLIEQPQYTRPRVLDSQEPPAELLSGNHLKIQEWKLRQSLLTTYAFRPDLIRTYDSSLLPHWAKTLLEELQARLGII